MFHVRDDFGKGPVSQVPSTWFNAVAKFLNNLVGGHGILIEKDGDAPSIAVNKNELGLLYPVPIDTTAEAPATVAARHPENVEAIPDDETEDQKQAREIADIGTSEFAARADHVHRIQADEDAEHDYGDFVTDEVCTEHEYCRKLTINWPRFDDKGLFIGYSTEDEGTQTEIHYTPGGDSE